MDAPRITVNALEDTIESEHYFTAFDGIIKSQLSSKEAPNVPAGAEHVTICVLFLTNGTKVVGVNTGPVSPANFDANMGRKMAREQAIEQIWPMLGYELRTKLSQENK